MVQTQENNFAISCKVKYIPTKPKGPTPRYYPREIKGYVHTKPIHKIFQWLYLRLLKIESNQIKGDSKGYNHFNGTLERAKLQARKIDQSLLGIECVAGGGMVSEDLIINEHEGSLGSGEICILFECGLCVKCVHQYIQNQSPKIKLQ